MAVIRHLGGWMPHEDISVCLHDISFFFFFPYLILASETPRKHYRANIQKRLASLLSGRLSQGTEQGIHSRYDLSWADASSLVPSHWQYDKDISEQGPALCSYKDITAP